MGKAEAGKNAGEELVQALSQPGAYPYEPEYIEHLQTHISHVFIAPPYVYKIKKAVDFGFLDFSTLEKRRHFCRREIALNRRLCAGIYLDVVTVRRSEGSYYLDTDEAGGEVAEYAVKMNKLDDRYFLHTFIEDGSLGRKHLDRLAQTLADFYRQQDIGGEVLQYGNIDHIRYNTNENFEQTEDFIGETIERLSYDAIRHYTDRYLDVNRSLFERRVEERRIVDGHGDLHLEHIHMTPEKVCIYDCIEFNERFRCGDVAADLAFLAMDLDFMGCWKDDRYFVQQMTEKLDDPELPVLIDFYKCYRAYVKGKVKSLQGREEEVEAAERRQAHRKAKSYFQLALRYALLGSHPTVVAFMGRVGTGKSTLAGRLAEALDIESYASDRIRKGLAGVPVRERTPAGRRDELYSSAMSQTTYRQLIKHAEAHLQHDESVILDATFSRPATRQELARAATTLGAQCLFVEVNASEQTIKERLQDREGKKGIVSDARLEDYEKLAARYESPDVLDQASLIRLNSDTDLNDTVRSLYESLAERQVREAGNL